MTDDPRTEEEAALDRIQEQLSGALRGRDYLDPDPDRVAMCLPFVSRAFIDRAIEINAKVGRRVVIKGAREAVADALARLDALLAEDPSE